MTKNCKTLGITDHYYARPIFSPYLQTIEGHEAAVKLEHVDSPLSIANGVLDDVTGVARVSHASFLTHGPVDA